MSRSSVLWQSVGTFFGISQSRTDNLQQWKNTAERKIKDGDYGIHLARRGSRKGSTEGKFVDQAEKVLSRISVSQAYEERDEAEQSQMAAVTTEQTSNGQISSTSLDKHLLHVPSTSQEHHLIPATSSDKQLPSGSKSKDIQLSATSKSKDLQLPSTSKSTEIQRPAASKSKEIQLLMASKSKDIPLPSSSESKDIQLSSTSKSKEIHEPSTSKEIVTTSASEEPGFFGKIFWKKKRSDTYLPESKSASSSTASNTRGTDSDHTNIQHRSRQVSINKLYEPEDKNDDDVNEEKTLTESSSAIITMPSQEKHVSFTDLDNVEGTSAGQADTVTGREGGAMLKGGSASSVDRKKSQPKVKLIFFNELLGESGSGVDVDYITVEQTSETVPSKDKSKLETASPEEVIMTETAPSETGVKSETTHSKSVEIAEAESSKVDENIEPVTTQSEVGEQTTEPCEEMDKGQKLDEGKEDESAKIEIDSLSKKPEELGAHDLVYGKEAFTHYSFYVQIEKKARKLELTQQLSQRVKEYDWKIQAIDELIQLAKAYYTNPQSKTATEWKELKRRVKRSSSRKITRTEVRHKLDALPEFRPFFTYCIIAVQLLAFCVVCFLGGVTYIGVEPRLSLETGIKTFVGTETVHKWTPPNIWIGPEQGHLISVGALFAPCMREDFDLQLLFSKLNYSKHTPLGCCEVAFRNTAGTTTETECDKLTDGVGFWRADVPCGQREPEDMGVAHILKPCCVDLKGQCELLTFKHCTFLRGHYHLTGPEHCTQVNCMADICNMGSLSSKSDQPWLLESPNQWWRLPLSLIYHHGLIHVILCVAAQWLLFRQVEQTAGWFRVMVIYILAGMAGLLTGALFSPEHPHVGSNGAIFGMVGVVSIELVQFWSMVHRPWLEVMKLVSALAVFLICGTLPYLDNFSLLSGLIVGMLLAVIMLPYITFGKWQTRVRLILVLTTVPVLFLVMFVLFYGFYKVQTFGSCETCKLINCVPYTDTMCNTSLWQ